MEHIHPVRCVLGIEQQMCCMLSDKMVVFFCVSHPGALGLNYSAAVQLRKHRQEQLVSWSRVDWLLSLHLEELGVAVARSFPSHKGAVATQTADVSGTDLTAATGPSGVDPL